MRRLILGSCAAIVLMSLLPLSAATATQPSPPIGVTGISLDGRVELAWQPSPGATSYIVYRGATPASITTLVTFGAGVTTTSFSDTSVTNGQTYYYVVHAVASGVESTDSLVVQASPAGRSCTAGNPIVVENCYPGSTGWRIVGAGSVANGGIEGFATATSINRGEAVDLKVKSGAGSTFHVEIYRSGYYGGAGARLVSVIRGVPGVLQAACNKDNVTGLIDCSNWLTSLTLTTTASWPTGVYMIRIVRDDTSSDNQILLTVRDDSSHSQVIYGVGYSTFQAYNNYGGKSLYNTNSFGNTTVAGTARAVKVSYDRPFEQPRSGQRDWYTNDEYPTVYWLESQGYDVEYISNTDLELHGNWVLNHRAYISSAHDEYFSSAMRSALEEGRDAGASLFFSGSNGVYWKIRFEDSPYAGGLNRVLVCYKTTQSGPADPSGIPTTTWRDPNGANKPENALIGEMYTGDADNTFFPLVVSADQGTDRVFRYTGLDSQTPGTSTSIGRTLVGWEWDARYNNGFEPAGLKTLSSSPVTGNLIQNNGANAAPGSTNVSMTKYIAASGALVFATGTNYWGRGLALDANGLGEPESRIQQITVNALADMGAQPQTPSTGIVLDVPDTSRPPAPATVSVTGAGTDSVSLTWAPVTGAQGYNVYRSTSPRSGGQPLGFQATAQPITATSFTDIGLASSSRYYYVVTAIVAGVQSPASAEVTATTVGAAGQPIRINVGGPDYTSSTGAFWRADAFFTGGNLKAVTTPISGTTDQALYQDERWAQFSYAIPVPNGVYDVRLHFVEAYYGTSQPGGAGKRVFSMDLGNTPANPDLSDIDIYNAVGPNAAYVRTVAGVSVTNGVLSIQSVYGCCDDPELAALEIIPQPSPPTVSLTVPSAGAIGISPYVAPHATFSRDMNASTITTSSFTLRSATGSLVPATVSYDSTSRTAILTPNATLALSTKYTARLDTTITASDGAPMAGVITWAFTTSATVPSPPAVTATTPADGATSVVRPATAQATFSRAMNPSTITAGSFTLSGPSGSVAATVTYDLTSQTAMLTPSSSLAYSTHYTARLSTSILAGDGTPLAAAFSWSFTTLDPPPPPTATAITPTDGSTYVSRTAVVTATFSRAMDPTTISPTTFTLRGADGNLLAATVSYSASMNSATLAPTQMLADNANFTAQLDTNVKSADGASLASAVSWSFATAACPCSLFSLLTVPASQNNSTQDGRTGVGPWSYELGVKIAADEPMQINAIRFYRSSKETGTHVGTVWTTSGIQLAQVAFVGETASGWQQQALPTPLSMTPGVTYVVSVNANAYFGLTQNAFLTPVIGGPLRGIADGANGTYGAATGAFPTKSYRSSNYFVDVSSAPTGDPVPPSVQSTGPASAAVGVVRTTTMQATFSRPVAPSTVNSSTFTLSGPGGSVPAAVTYNDATNTAVLTPASPLVYSTVYTARVSGTVRARDGMPLGTPVAWSFTVADAVSATVTSTVPAANATDIGSTAAPRAQFSKSIKPSTLTTSTFTLTGPSGAVAGAVAYDDSTKTATFTPSAPLPDGSYIARLDATITATDDATLATPYSWSFLVGPVVPPTVTTTTPTAGATDVARMPSITARFSRSMDPATINSSTFVLRASDGTAVAATASYDGPSNTATLTPNALLAPTAVYTASVTTGAIAADRTPLAAQTVWSFTTTLCPCSLMASTSAPSLTGNPVQDGRVGSGPWSYEFGVKIQVTQPVSLVGIRFYKDTKETGTHVGRLWSSTGTLLASATFSGETASGWQQATLSSPVSLSVGTTYIVSVGINAYFGLTTFGLQTQITSGPLKSVADSQNGVYGASAGTFPTKFGSKSSNYFVDAVVR